MHEGAGLQGARRILLHGVTGSGRTTAARTSPATGIPWTSVDDLTWHPWWVSAQTAGEDSISRWHFRSLDRRRERISARRADPAGPWVLRLSGSRDLGRWVAGLEPVAEDGPVGQVV